MSWEQLRRRNRLVQDVLADIDRGGEPVIPARLRADIDAEFGGAGGLLQDVQGRWYETFDARLDAVLEDGPADLPAELARLEREVDDVMPAARRLLDTYRAHPALAALHEHHARRLSAATGMYALGQPTAA
jgi:hypothetical protein